MKCPLSPALKDLQRRLGIDFFLCHRLRRIYRVRPSVTDLPRLRTSNEAMLGRLPHMALKSRIAAELLDKTKRLIFMASILLFLK